MARQDRPRPGRAATRGGVARPPDRSLHGRIGGLDPVSYTTRVSGTSSTKCPCYGSVCALDFPAPVGTSYVGDT